eukprot:IDg9473t1
MRGNSRRPAFVRISPRNEAIGLGGLGGDGLMGFVAESNNNSFMSCDPRYGRGIKIRGGARIGDGARSCCGLSTDRN